MALGKAKSSSEHPAAPRGRAASAVAIAEDPATTQAENAVPASEQVVADSAGEGAVVVQMTRPHTVQPAPVQPAPVPSAPPADRPWQPMQDRAAPGESSGPAAPSPVASSAAPSPSMPAATQPVTPPLWAGQADHDLGVGAGLGGGDPQPQGLVFPDALPGNVRRVEVSKRGKRDFNYTWARVDVKQMRDAYRHYLPLYSRMWQQRDPGGSYRLVFSAFVAKALRVAFEDFSPWLSTIRNDARKEPVAGGREQVGLVWPVEVERQVVEAWETLDRSWFPEGFALTKQNLASAAILYGLGSADRWVLSVGNDDRFNIPVDSDGRLRHNKDNPII